MLRSAYIQGGRGICKTVLADSLEAAHNLLRQDKKEGEEGRANKEPKISLGKKEKG